MVNPFAEAFAKTKGFTMINFKEANLPQALLHRLENIGFDTPTPIQSEAIPVALKGHDILGTAQTGTGKTGAFGIPLVAHLMNNTTGNALILLPTRELAVQVQKAIKLFTGKDKITSALIIGGESMPQQIRELKAKPRIIIGTPGRVNDHLERGTLQLHQTNFLVLDEVDRMLDMGFGIQLDAIAKFLTAKRQTLMFSATLPKNIERISSKYLTDPIRISVGATHAPAPKVQQENVKVADADKFARLAEVLKTTEGSVIVFIKTKFSADKIAAQLKKDGHKADALHGDMRQNARNRVVMAFRNKEYRVLVATDIASRGLDIPHIEHVINYDLPQCPEDYIHRIGRTGRAGAEGKALNFISPADGSKWRAIEQLLNPSAKKESPRSGEARSGEPKKSNRPFNKFRANKSGGRFKDKKAA